MLYRFLLPISVMLRLFWHDPLLPTNWGIIQKQVIHSKQLFWRESTKQFIHRSALAFKRLVFDEPDRDFQVNVSTPCSVDNLLWVSQSGGVISSNGRLQGRLEVSRAFGDRHFKKVMIRWLPTLYW